MFLILKIMYHEYLKAGEIFERDKRIASWPLVGQPWPMVLIIAFYLAFVLKWGPKFMENRKPFNTKMPMQIYNVTQVLINMYIFVFGSKYTYGRPDYSWSCQELNLNDIRPEVMTLRYPSYLYYMSKYMDLLDTIFFVLRKKKSQITFLHVYHHAMMIFAGWIYNTCFLGTHFCGVGIINSFIHVIMYSYYFAAAMNLNIDLTPWKRRLTTMQIIQFLCLTIHFAVALLHRTCQLNRFWLWTAFAQNFFILLLFSDFYIKTYIGKQQRLKK